MDVLPLLEADYRVTTVFTVVPAAGGNGRRGEGEFLRDHACLVLPWEQAVQCDFDLVLAASTDGFSELRGPRLLVPDAAPPCGLDRDDLARNGSVVALAHESELAALRESYPEAMSAVVGDVCYDRLLASIPFRARYRQAFGLDRGQKLVMVSSTWQSKPAVDRQLELLDALPSPEFRVAALVDPDVWAAASRPPDEGWRATLIAADLLVGNYGTVTRYGAAIGLPVMRTDVPRDCLRPAKAAELLRRHAPLLRQERSLVEQVRAAMAADRGWQDEVAGQLTSVSGFAGEHLRAVMYGLLGLDEPARAVPCSPVPLPRFVTTDSMSRLPAFADGPGTVAV